MSGTTNAQKRLQSRDLHQFGDKKSQDWLQRTPKGVPCTVVSVSAGMATVKLAMNSAPFTLPNVTVPQSQSLYFREPTQAGDEGYLDNSDYYLGGVSGLGGGVADLTPRGNLTTGIFRPITRKSFPAMVDPNKAQVQGPNGFVLQSIDQSVSIIGDKAAATLTIKVGSLTVVFSAAGTKVTVNGNEEVSGTLTVDGEFKAPGIDSSGGIAVPGEVTAMAGSGNSVGLASHTTEGILTGTDTSGPPTPGS